MMGDALNTLGEMGKAINTELDTHEGILDNLNQHTELGKRRVQRENQRIEEFEVKSSTCGMWVAIIVLFVLIIILAATKGGCYIIFGTAKCDRPSNTTAPAFERFF